MEEHRQSTRIPFPYPIEQLVQHKSDYPRFAAEDEYLSAQGLDLSSGGLKVESASSIEPLTRVFVMFTLPGETGGGRRIRCEGFVAHSRREGPRCSFGIRFCDLSPEDQSAIDSFIASSFTGQSGP